MASNTRTVTGVGVAVFDFTTTRKGNVSFFSNDLNITWGINAQAPGVLLRLHTGPIMFVVTSSVGANVRITAVPTSIGSGFPPPALSLLQVQSDALPQL